MNRLRLAATGNTRDTRISVISEAYAHDRSSHFVRRQRYEVVAA
ncbi:hypothetical protein NSU_1076 [Novosphingobium pentaromativorans US6-1]|uniref:Uncharacterized protein n=1 Tax=Novosphingobium pentaromativorans US6-1 TaxID=1088721 RepID=G6E9Q5_9SPHN|nr:hypothetical protein NSU_1076 [Novosphingobium pentaromativorans US6-1]